MSMQQPDSNAPINERRLWYRTVYLRSTHWKQRRVIALLIAGKMCEACFSSRGLQVHHLTYVNLGKEKDEDLMVLCDQCHDIAHALGTKRPEGVTLKDMRKAIYNIANKKKNHQSLLQKKFERALERLGKKKKKK